MGPLNYDPTLLSPLFCIAINTLLTLLFTWLAQTNLLEASFTLLLLLLLQNPLSLSSLLFLSLVMVISPTNSTIKFLCSYGGKILPRYPDGKLRYNGGHTRVLAVPRSVGFSELASKMAEMCGSTTVTIRCQLPNEDLDALVSITSDEDLRNLIEEYDIVSSSSSSPTKIRVFLNPPQSKKPTISPPPLALPTSTSSSSTTSSSSSSSSPRSPSSSKPPLPPSPPRSTTTAKNQNQCYGCYVHRNTRNIYLVHNGNHWQ